MANNEKAKKLLDLAIELSNEGKNDEAIEVYKQTISVAPTWATPYYNLGLIYKYRSDWQNSLIFNAKATELDPADKPSAWNWATAATALKDWKTARKAWKTLGIKIPIGDENAEIRLEIGITPVRLKENHEVVWVERIDPARATIVNIPTPESKRRFHDIILNDGAPNGTRTHGGREFPVFDELDLFEKSKHATFSAWVKVIDVQSLQKLQETLEGNDCGFENWTKMIRYVCQQCSEGTPHEHHDNSLAKKVENGEYHLGLAAKSEIDLKHLLRNWELQTRSRLLEFEKVL